MIEEVSANMFIYIYMLKLTESFHLENLALFIIQ